MVLFDVGQRVYNEGRIGIVIDTFVGEDGNTRYVVKFESSNPKVVEVVENFLAKDLELVEGVLMYAKPYVDSKIEELKERVEKLNKKPKLVIIRANNDEPSERYIRNKIKKCEEVGVLSEIIRYDENVTQEEIKNKIEELNSDDEVCGILLQLPIYEHLDSDYLIDQICPYKEIDGFCTYNMGRLALGKPLNVACTSLGIVRFLEFNNIDLKGKTVTIVNASNVIGKPLAHLVLQRGGTPIVCHIHTKNLKHKMKMADIVVLGTGNADFVGVEDFVKGQIVIDVSINVGKNGKLCGDIKKEDYDKLLRKGVSFTPVPRGCGELTVLTLVEQTVSVAEKREEN